MVAARGENELVSVVIPAYNAGATIAETLASALGQTYPDLEIIVVDDGSTDDTAAVVAGAAANDARIRLLRQANSGVAAARNYGIAEARADLVAILDADDLWHPTKIAKQVAAIRQGGAAVGLVYTWHRHIDEKSRVVSNFMQVFREGDVYAALILSNFVGGGSTALIRRACLEEVGGFDSRFQGAADIELFLRIAERYDFLVVPEYLMGYRRSAGSMSRDVWHMLRQQELVLAKARQRHPGLPGRLFRWGRGQCGCWLAQESLRSARVGAGAYLLLRTLVHDPPAVFQPAIGRAVLRGVAKRLLMSSPLRPATRWLLQRLHLGGTWHSLRDEGWAGPSFLDAAPEATTLPARAGRSRSPRFDKRFDTVATWRVDARRPDGTAVAGEAAPPSASSYVAKSS